MKVEEYKIQDWEEEERGLLVSEDDNWILVKHIPVDYVIDGYKVYKKDFITERNRTDTEKQIEKVLTLKGVDTQLPDSFNFGSAIEILSWAESKYGFFEFQDDEESAAIYGKVNTVDGNFLTIDMIDTDGSVECDYDYEFEIDEIRVITFETDYYLSVQLLWEDQKAN